MADTDSDANRIAPHGGKLPSSDICSDVFEHMLDGVAYCRMLYQEGHPHDFVYLYTNPALHTLTGLGPVIGKLVSEIMPEIRESDPRVLEVCGRLSTGGSPVEFEIFVKSLGHWFEVRAYSPRAEHFLAIFRVISGQKNAVQAVSEAEHRYRTLANGVSTLLWRSGTDKQCNFFNQSWLRFTGRTLEQELGDGWAEGVHPDDLAACVEIYSNAFERRVPFRMEYRLHHADGSYRWIEDDGRPTYDVRGQFLGYVGACTDITDRKRAEALLQARLRLSDLGQTGSMNQLMQAALDAAEEVTGSQIGFFHLVDPDQEHLTLQSWSTNTLAHMCTADGNGQHRRISEAGVWVECVRAQTPVIHNDYANLLNKKGMPEGHAKVVRELVVPIVRYGRVVKIFGVGNKLSDYTQDDIATVQMIASMAQDVVDSRRVQAALHVSEERLKFAMEGANDGIWDVDMRTNRVYLSPRGCAMLGYGSEEFSLSAKQWSEMVHPDDLAHTNIQLAEHLGGGSPLFSVEQRLLTKSGEWIWVLARGKVNEFIDGRPGRMTGTHTDITERKQAEASARLAHEQLRQLAKRLDAVHEAESSLLSRELHDEFGQMLTSLKMDLAWLASQLGEGNRELKEKVASSVALVEASVKSVRSIAARLRPRILDELGLVPAIEWLVRDFRERSGIDAAVVSNTRAGALTPEQATAVFRIVQESLTNIARHADATCVDVGLDAQNGWLTAEVRDDGRGLREGARPNHESIGLLGMRERALAAGGELVLQSVPGRGTIVTVRLPHKWEKA